MLSKDTRTGGAVFKDILEPLPGCGQQLRISANRPGAPAEGWLSTITVIDGGFVGVSDGRGQPRAKRLGDQSPRPPGILLGMGRNDLLAWR